MTRPEDVNPDDFESEEDYEKAFVAAGGTIVDGGSIEDAPTEILAQMFPVATGGMKAYVAALIVDRGGCCTASDCMACDEVRAYAVQWKQAAYPAR